MAKSKAQQLADEVAALSDKDLMAEWTALGKEVQEGKERLRAFSAEHQKRTRKEQLLRLADMSDEDMALLQEARSEAIESEESVHNG